MSLVRILAYVLAAFMAFMGIQKFIGDAPIFQIIETNTGMGFIEPWFKYLTGVLELLAALMLVLGKRFEGGLLALIVLVGAVTAHLTVLGISVPMAAGSEPSPMLFIMALGGFILSAAVTGLSRDD